MESIQRLTPAKFTTAHVKGSLTSRGQLLKILAHYPLDGQPATLEIHENLPCFDDFRKEFLNFPGPLVKGVTHKNNILRYCKQKIKDADSNSELFDKESYKLIWELLILLIRQNGTVVGTDIAELLMSNRSSHVAHQPTATPVANDGGKHSNISEEDVTNQFRDYLIYGNTKEALEWAMKHGLWGHALFLASKMDQRTYASVMTRFANGLTMNDPLQTLYQLMSGKQPASVTCCADEKWGDWRPHLAMILSNSTARPDLDLKAVTTLGDTLGSRGNLHAAHFCYLMAQVEFGTFAHKSSKIVLIGSSHTQPFHQFANNEAIFATEIFEFACSLADADFALHHLQHYKLLMAKRLTEVGLVQEAVHYVEVIANTIAKFPSQYPPYFIQEVYDLGNMLKYFDPVYNSSEGTVSDPEWLLHLLNILNDYQTGVLQHDGCGSVSNLTTYSENEGVQNLPLDPVVQDTSNEMQSWQNQQQMYYDQQQQPLQQQPQQQQQWHQNDQSNYGFHSANKSFLSVEQSASVPSSAEGNRPYWGNQNQWMQPQVSESNEMQQPNENEYLSGVGVETTDSNQNHSLYNYYDSNRNEKSPTSKSVSTSAFIISGSHRCHSAPKLTKQLSLSLGPSVKQTKKSFKCLKPPLNLPLFHHARDKLIQSELSLNNPKTKHLAIPNPNYFMHMKERKESSSSNHTDNEDSNNEDVRYASLQLDKTKRLRTRLREKKYLSQDVVFSSEDSKDKEEAVNSDGVESDDKKIRKLKGKVKRRKSLSLWCLQKTDEDYKILETLRKEQLNLIESPDVTDSPDDVFVKKSRRRGRSCRRGSRVPLREDVDDNTDSEAYIKESKFNNKLLTRLKLEKSQFWRNSTEIITQSLEKPTFWRSNSTETAIFAINSRKIPDACAKTLSKKLFMNLKLSLFGNNERPEKMKIVGRRPIVFGGTFPIDMPLGGDTRNRIVVEKDVTDKVLPMSEVRTFEIDAPIGQEKPKPEVVTCGTKVDLGFNTYAIDEPYFHKRIPHSKKPAFHTP